VSNPSVNDKKSKLREKSIRNISDFATGSVVKTSNWTIPFLSDDDWREIDKMRVHRIYPIDTVILRQDRLATRVIKIISGKIRMERYISDNQAMIIALLGEGTIFGMGGLLNKAEYAAAVAATDSVEVIEYPIPTLLMTFEKLPDLAGHFYHFIAISIVGYLEAAAKPPAEYINKKRSRRSLSLETDPVLKLEKNTHIDLSEEIAESQSASPDQERKNDKKDKKTYTKALQEIIFIQSLWSI